MLLDASLRQEIWVDDGIIRYLVGARLLGLAGRSQKAALHWNKRMVAAIFFASEPSRRMDHSMSSPIA